MCQPSVGHTLPNLAGAEPNLAGADQVAAGKDRRQQIRRGQDWRHDRPGTGGAAYLLLAYRRYRPEEVDTRERRITELYTKALEQLGHEKGPACAPPAAKMISGVRG
jgi:hypothetical protein